MRDALLLLSSFFVYAHGFTGKRRMRDGTAEKEALPEAIEKSVFWQKELYGRSQVFTMSECR